MAQNIAVMLVQPKEIIVLLQIQLHCKKFAAVLGNTSCSVKLIRSGDNVYLLSIFFYVRSMCNRQIFPVPFKLPLLMSVNYCVAVYLVYSTMLCYFVFFFVQSYKIVLNILLKAISNYLYYTIVTVEKQLRGCSEQ